jgi:acetolactate synthase-1/2/3 large subunit
LSNINKLISYLTESYQPLFYLGGGIIRSNNFKCIQQIAKLFQIPVTTTLMGKSSYNESDNLALGMLGMHGTAYANFAVSECDLLLAIGARFDDRVTGKLDEFACDAEVIHLDIDPAEISKNRSPQLGIIGDSRKILLEMLKRLRYQHAVNAESWILEIFEKNNNQTQSWLKRIIQWKDAYPLISNNYASTHIELFPLLAEERPSRQLSPQETISFIGKKYKHSFFTTDVGQHQMWSAQLINCEPKKWVSSSGLGTMGFGLPSAIGAKIANPEQFVVCISGDSSFQMSIQELGTISQYRLGIKMVIINNGWQGMVRQWQQSFYGNRFSNSYMRNGMPNFAEVAKAYNIEGFSIQNIEMLEKIIEFDLAKKEKGENLPLLLDINVVENENCYPMVAPGRSNSQMLGITKEEEL